MKGNRVHQGIKSFALGAAFMTGTVVASAPNVQAASKPSQYTTRIVVNQKTLDTPHALTLGGTTYVPLFYVHNVLYALGLQDYWNGAGNRQSWDITGSGFSAVNLSIKAKTGTVNIYLNGKLVEQNVPRTVAVDPDSGSQTTYVPIWYVQQLLTALGVTNTWDASSSEKTWRLSYHKRLILGNGIQYAPDGTLYTFAADGVYRYSPEGWSLVSGSDSIGVIAGGVIRSDGSIIVLGENDMWQFTNGTWSELDNPGLDSRTVVLDYNMNPALPFTMAGSIGNNNYLFEYQNDQWTVLGGSAGANDKPLFVVTKPDGTVFYETKADGIWQCTNGHWTQLPWFTSDGSDRCLALEVSPDGVLTAASTTWGSLLTQVWQYNNGSWSPIAPQAGDYFDDIMWENGTLTAVGAIHGIWQYANGVWTQTADKRPTGDWMWDSNSKGDITFFSDNGVCMNWHNGSWTTLSTQIIHPANG